MIPSDFVGMRRRGVKAEDAEAKSGDFLARLKQINAGGSKEKVDALAAMLGIRPDSAGDEAHKKLRDRLQSIKGRPITWLRPFISITS